MCCLAGADLTIAASNGFTALHIAIRRGDPAIVQSMLEHGASVDCPLHFGRTENMLRHSTSVDVRTSRLRTPLMVAVLNYHREDRVIQALIAAKADLNAVDEDGTTALTMAINHIVHADNNVKYGAPASACIALIEAG